MWPMTPGYKSLTVILNGTTLWTRPYGVQVIIVEVWGAGGGGSGSSTGAVSASCPSGGAGGGYARKLITFPNPSYACVVGAGGAGGAAGNNAGTNGGDTEFGSGPVLCKATGGVGGAVMGAGATVQFPGHSNGGIGTIGDILLAGFPAGIAFRRSGTEGRSGDGGNASVGGGGAPGRLNTNAGVGATSYGAGGSAGCTLNGGAAQAGGDGANGVIFVWEYGHD